MSEAERRVTGLVFMKLESERVPRKNLREVGGRPLFEWIFEALTRAERIGEIILNTDSEILADAVANRFDVRIHMRPPHLLTIQTDEANQIIGYDVDESDAPIYLQTHSTNPLLRPETIDLAVDTFLDEALAAGHDSLFTVTSHQKRFFFSDGRAVNHDPKRLIKTQELPPLYEENSCIYLFTRDAFYANQRRRIGAHPRLLPISAREAIDIDTEEDLRLADQLLRAAHASEERHV